MITLSFTVDNISTVRAIYDRIEIQRADSEEGTFEYITSLVPPEIELQANQSAYSAIDYDGETTHWYRSRYYSTTSTGTVSAWSDPVLGEDGDIYYNPLYPEEISYGTADKRIIDRIRIYIGDPIGLRREYGNEALSSVHADGKTYEMDEKGWPAYVNMGGVQFSSTTNPSVNGYRFLRFSDFIDDICTTCSGYVGACGEDVLKEVVSGVDIWYYTFRYSDRQIMEAYDNCPPPPPLTESTATSQAYMLQTAIDLLVGELWEDATEDGASIRDEGSHYDPEPGLEVRRKLLDNLRKKLDDLIKTLLLTEIEGVLID